MDTDITSKAKAVEAAVRERIRRGTYARRDWLPFLSEIAAEFGVTRGTVSLALVPLQKEKLVGSLTGRGRALYVIDPDEPAARPPSVRGSEEIETILRARLKDHTYAPDSRLPSRDALAREFGVSLAVITAALRPIKFEGLVYVDGKRNGTYVTDPQRPRPVNYTGHMVKETVRKRIGDGAYAPRAWLPLLSEFAAEFSVTIGTVSSALVPLQRERLIGIAPRNRGLYVIDPDEPAALPAASSPHHVEHVEALLRERLRDGSHAPGSRLPSRVELAEELGVSASTVTRALSALRSEGLIAVRGVKGTYVTQKAIQGDASLHV